jgi:tetratricopeptide (TPR) repeat protein
MTKSEKNQRMKEINAEIKNDEKNALIMFNQLVKEVNDSKDYSMVIDLAKTRIGKKHGNDIFEFAFAYSEMGNKKKAEQIYRHFLISHPDNTAALNNLAIIVEKHPSIKEAYDLIEHAYEIDEDDEIISKNYVRISEKYDSIERQDRVFRDSIELIENENQFVKGKLEDFANNVRKDPDYKNARMPIPNWKFRTLMQTREDLAESLKKQWLDKGYIYDTGERADRNVRIYEVNPYLFTALDDIKSLELNENWMLGFERLEANSLRDIDYFTNRKKIMKTKAKFKNILLRDYDELVVNYMYGNEKSTIILSGSIAETLLIYYFEKKKVSKITYSRNNKTVSKNLYDTQLNDLLTFIDENKVFPKQFVHLGNIMRIYRNYIHPGRELKESDQLVESKAEICYRSLNELIKVVIR